MCIHCVVDCGATCTCCIEYRDAIERVNKLHYPIDGNDSVCGDPDCCGEYIEGYTICHHCLEDYPCTTLRRMDGE